MIEFSLIGETRQRKEFFLFIVDFIHAEQFHGSSRIFADEIFQFLEKFQRSERDIVLISDGSRD